MEPEKDDYDVFLDTWEPSQLLEHATLASNAHDPVARMRLLEGSSGIGDVSRTPFAPGLKGMDDDESFMRKHDFLEDRQPEWSALFRDRLVDEGIDTDRADLFITSFAKDWVDGMSRRQSSDVMMRVKASIRDHDRTYHAAEAGKFVLTTVDETIAPLFDPAEMKIVFDVNSRLIDALIADYLDAIGEHSASSINHLYVRRGVFMPFMVDQLKERFHLSSYSLALTPIEQFAQTWTPETRETGVPSIFSAPLPAVQQRIVAFAPFIKNMTLGQLELVVAPPVSAIPLAYRGEFGGIHEYEFE